MTPRHIITKTEEVHMEEEEVSHFMEQSVAYGLHMQEFENIEEDKRKKLIRLMARIMESSYRRGAQQSLYMERNGGTPTLCSERELYEYRYDPDIDTSVGITGFTSSSIDRLFTEYRVLQHLGFWNI